MKKLFLLVLLLIVTHIYSQDKRFEEVYQECIYKSLPDNGKNLKRYIDGFEQHLISLKILNSKNGKSYLELFKTLAEGRRYPSEYKYSYIDSINTLEIKILPHNKECIENAMKHESYANYFMRFFDKKDYEIYQNSDSIDLKNILKETYEKMRENDYELDFYRHQLFIILFLINEIDRLDNEVLPD